MRLGQLMRDGQELDVTFQTFETNAVRARNDRGLRSRRNGNQRGEFSPLGAWFRHQMLRLLIRANARGMNWRDGDHF